MATVPVRLKISLAGRVSIRTDGVAIDEERLPGRQGRLVFAYLVSEHARPVTRDELAEALWGATPPARWEKALGVIASKLRALLGECRLDGAKVLTSAFGCYRLELPAGTWVDILAAAKAVDEAEAALAHGDAEKARAEAATAVSIARLPLLPGEEGAWIAGKRREIADVLVRALEALAEACLRSGEASEAARWAEEAITLEPFRETGYRRLMQAHAATGNKAEALRVYERCRRLLADELGAYPSPETEAIYRELLKLSPAGDGARAVPVEETAAPKPARRPSRRFMVAATLAALAGVIAAAVAIPLFALGGDENVDEIAGTAVGVVDTGSGAVKGGVETPAPPTAVAAGLGFVWAVSADSNTVVVVDPATNTVRDTIPVESAPSGIAIGGGWVWVTNSLTGTVSQISPQTLAVVQTIPVGNGPTGIAAGEGYVWVANTSDHTVSKLRVTDGKVLDTFAAGPDPGAVAFGEGAVWVASKLSATLVKLSPSSGEILDRIPVGGGPAGVAIGAGSVWVANSLSGTVSRIDPRAGDVRGTIEIGPSADAVAVARGDVWVASGLGGTVSRIAARDGRVTTIDIGNRPTALAAGDGTLYVGLRPSGASHAGGTLRLAFSGVDRFQIDPANTYSPGAWSTLILTNDGLVGWKRVGGQAGVELVPDLAVSLPSVSDDRRTYTFQLRRGIRYSNGRLVKASDVRNSIERVYKLKPQREPAAVEFYRAIVGADRCSEQPSRCDLSRGIVTDDRAGTVAFHLSAPDPEFLFKLALPFAYVLPTGTSLHEAVQRPLPGTGPYRVASVSRGRALRLVRNARFREWSSAAQPAGFPDEIVVTLVPDSAQRARLVAQGEADWASPDPGETLPVPLRYRPQLHVQPLSSTIFLAFDTTRSPFNDVRVRRALNYAVDRNEIVRLVGGPDAAKPTCQVLPPNFPGYRRYCPYTLDPSPGSAWTAPDLAKARRLVLASGTAGARVVLWWHGALGEGAGRYFEALLDSLGYRARLRLFSGDFDAYYSASGRPAAPWHIVANGWFADYPAASNFIGILRCSPDLDLSRYCNRPIDAKIRRSLRLQEHDPVAANDSWAALDRELTDQAPWIFLYTQYSADFVSERVGNYQHHPLWGTLFAQLWIR